MANQLEKGRTFNPGDTVEAADLNNLVDLGTALPGIISEATAESPLLDTSQVLVRTATGFLRKRSVASLPSGVTDVNAAASPAFFNLVATTPSAGVRLITASFDQQNQNKVLAAPADGALAAPGFRALVPADLPIATIAIPSFDIDWNLGVMFSKTLTANAPFTHSNASPGQTIRVLVRQDVAAPPARTVTFAGVRWPGGTDPVMTPTAGAYDLFTFHFISGSLYLGTFEQNFLI